MIVWGAGQTKGFVRFVTFVARILSTSSVSVRMSSGLTWKYSASSRSRFLRRASLSALPTSSMTATFLEETAGNPGTDRERGIHTY